MNKLTIFSDTHFVLCVEETALTDTQMTKFEEKIKGWIANGGLLVFPFLCEVENLRYYDDRIVTPALEGDDESANELIEELVDRYTKHAPYVSFKSGSIP